MLRGIPGTLMRGGTSKALYFHARDLPQAVPVRDRVLLAALGSPDPRQIDGVGGAHPLTSKVAIISPSARADADVDYLFLQVVVDKAEVSDSQNCGNILAGVGPWSIENGLVPLAGERTPVRIHMLNTGSIAVAQVPTPGGAVEYEGDARIEACREARPPLPSTFWTWRALRVVRSFRPVPASIAAKASRSPASTTACPWCCCAPPTWASAAMNHPRSWKPMRRSRRASSGCASPWVRA
jgi:2-methylaconitate cis-trans-isomerase PrpF